MENPHKHRCSEQHFLNLPGYQAGAYIRAYVEDSSCPQDEEELIRTNENSLPYQELTLEISDCYKRINLEFDVRSAEQRLNSFHKVDTMIAALQAFRDGMEAESRLCRDREMAREAHREEQRRLEAEKLAAKTEQRQQKKGKRS